VVETHQPQVTNLSGLPTLWTPVGQQPAATLRFRVGQADEPLHCRGFTRLTETILAHHLNTDQTRVRTATGAAITTIATTGTASELPAIIQRTLDLIYSIGTGAYPDTVIAGHAATLRRDHPNHRGGVTGEIFSDLYGATSLGVLNFGEFGLQDFNVDHYRQWVSTRFSRANALLSLRQPPPPANENWTLFPGQQSRPITLAPVFEGWPAARRSVGPFGLVAPVFGRDGYDITTTILSRAINTDATPHPAGELRATYQPLTSGGGVVMATMPHSRDLATIATKILTEIDRLATEGPRGDELAAAVQATTKSAGSLSARAKLLDHNSEEFILGGTPVTEPELVERYHALTSDKIAECAQKIQNAMALRIPPDAELLNERIRLVFDRNDTPVEAAEVFQLTATAGTKRRASAAPPTESELPQIRLGTNAVSLIRPTGHCTTIRAADVKLLLRWADKTETLIGAAGDPITVLPDRWQDDHLIRSRLAEWVDPTQIKTGGLRGHDPAHTPAPTVPLATPWIRWAAIWAMITPATLLLAAFGPSSTSTRLTLLVSLSCLHLVAGWRFWRHYRQRHNQLNSSRVYDDATRHDPSWGTTETPQPADDDPALWRGGVLVEWLATNRLFTPWVEEGARADIHDFHHGRISGPELYRRLGAKLSSDMCAETARSFLNHAMMPNAANTPNDTALNKIFRLLPAPTALAEAGGFSAQPTNPTATAFARLVDDYLSQRHLTLSPWANDLQTRLRYRSRLSQW